MLDWKRIRLESGRVRLRPLDEADLPLTLAWRNRDEIRTWFFHPEVITPGEHRAWYKAYLDRPDDAVFIIEAVEAPAGPVGQVALYHIDESVGRAELGRLMIGEPGARGKGLAKEATRLLLDFARRENRLREVILEVYDHNAPALAIYRACGFETRESRAGVLTMVHRIDP